MSNEIVTTSGEETELMKPDNFGDGLSFLNPDDMPDLDNAEVGINIQPEYMEFKNPGDAMRGVFNGITSITTKDKQNPDQYKNIEAVVLQTKTGVKLNAGASLVKQFKNLRVGTAVQIVYKGEEKTNSGNKVKTYDVNLLNVGRVPVHPIQKSEPKAEQQPEPKKDYITMFWSKVKELRLNNEEASQIIAQFDGNFEKAYTEITSPF